MRKAKIPIIYEAAIWALYVGVYKYAYYVSYINVQDHRQLFPYPQIIFYVIVLSLYWLIYYRMALPYILGHRKYWLLPVVIPLFVLILSVPNDYMVSWLFGYINANNALSPFYATEFEKYAYRVQHLKGWSLVILVPDLIAFSSVAFLRFAIDSEYRKWQIERHNYQLKIDSLRARINPHFLFNMLNSVYGMTLLGKKDTPEFILQMSNAMRYILYESNTENVLLEKEVEFVESFLAIEGRRLNNVKINLTSQGIDATTTIAPLILLPFIENAIKHGAHHFKTDAEITCSILQEGKKLFFEIINDIQSNYSDSEENKGIGIENVKARLELYYPGRYTLTITPEINSYRVYLSIDLS